MGFSKTVQQHKETPDKSKGGASEKNGLIKWRILHRNSQQAKGTITVEASLNQVWPNRTSLTGRFCKSQSKIREKSKHWAKSIFKLETRNVTPCKEYTVCSTKEVLNLRKKMAAKHKNTFTVQHSTCIDIWGFRVPHMIYIRATKKKCAIKKGYIYLEYKMIRENVDRRPLDVIVKNKRQIHKTFNSSAH